MSDLYAWRYTTALLAAAALLASQPSCHLSDTMAPAQRDAALDATEDAATQDATQDAATQDADQDEEASPSCTGENIAQLCVMAGAQCGKLSVMDRCGVMRDVSCGSCREGECLSDNSCSICQPESDTAFCMGFQARCGELERFDLCGTLRNVVSCGSCISPQICDLSTWQCRCPTESDPLFCERQGAECGELTAPDSCGNTRTAQCGTCNPGMCLPNNNTCSECQAETDKTLCEAENATCGQISVVDRCGATRSPVCGTCMTGASCTPQNTCQCPVPSCEGACGILINECLNDIDCGPCLGGLDCFNNVCQ